MTKRNILLFRAVGIMIGAIVGVGVFGLPYAFSKSGFALGAVELLVMAVLLTSLQLMLAEVVVQTPGRHRLVGYVQMYLGKTAGRVTLFALSAGIWGAMVAYMIVGGRFSHLLLSPILGGSEFVYGLAIASIAGFLIYRGLRFASVIEVGIVGVLIFLFLFLIGASIPEIQLVNLSTVDWSQAFLPYGVVLFSMAGVGAVPEIRDVLGRRFQNDIARAVLISMSIIVLLYFLFSGAVLGVTGTATTQAAFDGLVPHIGGSFRVVASLLGSVTILSIFMVLGVELLNTLRVDYRLSHTRAWILVVFVPVLLFLFGTRELIDVIGFVGSVFGGAIGIFIALTYLKLKNSPVCKEHTCVNFPVIFTWLIILLFSGGIIYTIFTSFIN